MTVCLYEDAKHIDFVDHDGFPSVSSAAFFQGGVQFDAAKSNIETSTTILRKPSLEHIQWQGAMFGMIHNQLLFQTDAIFNVVPARGCLCQFVHCLLDDSNHTAGMPPFCPTKITGVFPAR